MMFAALMLFGGAAQAQDICDTLGDYPEAGFCDAYCVAMDCDLIGDADPIEFSPGKRSRLPKCRGQFPFHSR